MSVMISLFSPDRVVGSSGSPPMMEFTLRVATFHATFRVVVLDLVEAGLGGSEGRG